MAAAAAANASAAGAQSSATGAAVQNIDLRIFVCIHICAVQVIP